MKKTQTDDIFEANRLAKERRKQLEARKNRLKWLSDNAVGILALIVSVVALIISALK